MHNRAAPTSVRRMSEKSCFVYMLASKRNGTLYIGVTSNLVSRIYIHREDLVPGFTRRYGIHLLVWYEWIDGALPAIHREKQLKKWNRAWKIRLIEEMNPTWEDLYPKLIGA
jgi:putative endonuclease